MQEIQVNSFSAYIAYVEEGEPYLLYRGVSKAEYRLVPSIGRDWKGGLGNLRLVEDISIKQLKLRGSGQLDTLPANDFEWLVLAQHYGIPTRLLDWTSNPLAALYFACSANFKVEGAVYNLTGPAWLDLESPPNPFALDTDSYFQPRHFLPRIAAQSSFFTISTDPLTPLEDRYGPYEYQGKSRERIIKLIIPQEAKDPILRTLLSFGIGPASLFPGLDGLCREIAAGVTFLKQGILSVSEIPNAITEAAGALEARALPERGKTRGA